MDFTFLCLDYAGHTTIITIDESRHGKFLRNKQHSSIQKQTTLHQNDQKWFQLTAIHKKQKSIVIIEYEASKVIGLTPVQTITRIIIPQVVKIVLPSVGNVTPVSAK
jgi:hypothetical protein